MDGGHQEDAKAATANGFALPRFSMQDESGEGHRRTRDSANQARDWGAAVETIDTPKEAG